MGKGEIARYEQFLLFPQCFQKTCFQGRQKVSLSGNELINVGCNKGPKKKCYAKNW